MIAGAGGEVATRAEAVLEAVRPAGSVPVPGRARRADLLDAAFLGGTAAHGIELDDGYTKGSVHPGCTVVPAALAVGYAKGASGKDLIEAMVAGYETVTAIGRACHPALRHRGFHPTGAVVGVRRRDDDRQAARALRAQLANALGIAASSSGRTVRLRQWRRRHQAPACRPRRARRRAGGAARRAGRRRPARRDRGARRLHAGLCLCAADEARPITLPPEGPFGMTDCYIKPNPCCRHIQPATEALIALLKDERHRDRGGQARRGRDLSHRGRACRDRLG